MANKRDAETLREIFWTVENRAPDLLPENREPWTLAARAPADWLDRFTADSYVENFRLAAEALEACGRLRRAAAFFQRYGETLCNIPLSEAEAERLERDAERNKARVAGALSALFGDKADRLAIETGGDPRGASVKVYRREDRAESGGNGSTLFTL